MKVREENEKVGLKLSLHKTKIMANRLGSNRNSERIYFGGLQITADSNCSHGIKRRLFLERKAVTNLDSIFKSRDITLPTKVHLVKAMVFSISHVWMWNLDYKESWTQKNWCFWSCGVGEDLRVPWTALRSNQSILKEISPEYSLEGLMLKLKLQYFGYLM